MFFSRFSTTNRGSVRSGLVTSIVILAVFPTLSLAQDRPAFHAPTLCGQVWDVSTYGPPGKNHAPDPDSLDFALRDGEGANASRGQPVLASAAGVVQIDRTLGNGLRYLMVDHENGWRTHYLHNEEEEGKPRLNEGRKVAAGEMIGRAGDTGSSTVHIHYTQVQNVLLDAAGLDGAGFWGKMRDGEAVRAAFDGDEVSTHQGDTSSWGTWGNNSAEEIRSSNCSGNQFQSWIEDGTRYFLRYRPSNGRIRINRFDHPAGLETTQIIQRNWGRNWAHFVNFLPDGSNRRHMMGYDFATGATRFWEISRGGADTTELNEVNIYAGWTHMKALKIGNSDHLISYDSRYGHFNVDRINAGFTGFISGVKTNVGKGYTHLVPYWSGQDRFLLLYKGGNGNMRILRLSRRGDVVSVETTWNVTRTEGWTHLTALPRGRKMYLFGYRSDTGDGKLWEIKSDGSGLDPVKEFDWTKNYSTFTPFAVGNTGHLLVQKIKNGRTKSLKLKADLSGFETLMTSDWASGWR